MIPLTKQYSDDPVKMQRQLNDSYQDIAAIANGRIDAWTPTLFGSGTAGTPTYGTVSGYYFVQGIMADVWFDIAWTGAGTCAGNIKLNLPVMVSNEGSWTFPVVISAVTLTANYTIACVQLDADTSTATLQEASATAGSAKQALTWAKTSGSIYGHLRYPIKRDLSRH